MKRKAYCNLCYVNFKYNSKFKKHVEKVHKNDQEFLERDLTDEDLKFPCVKCDKKFVKEAILRNHLAFHKQVEAVVGEIHHLLALGTRRMAAKNVNPFMRATNLIL